ncbi:hypothetical protein FBY31_0056 [Arthrobacter sp. SLBN-100]|nr:hypothetical protein FBY31_0056 [Arthrobacter sp. SLBN-100]
MPSRTNDCGLTINCATTNMNATVSWVTTCLMMDITKEDVLSPETVRSVY